MARLLITDKKAVLSEKRGPLLMLAAFGVLFSCGAVFILWFSFVAEPAHDWEQPSGLVLIWMAAFALIFLVLGAAGIYGSVRHLVFPSRMVVDRANDHIFVRHIGGTPRFDRSMMVKDIQGLELIQSGAAATEILDSWGRISVAHGIAVKPWAKRMERFRAWTLEKVRKADQSKASQIWRGLGTEVEDVYQDIDKPHKLKVLLPSNSALILDFDIGSNREEAQMVLDKLILLMSTDYPL